MPINASPRIRKSRKAANGINHVETLALADQAAASVGEPVEARISVSKRARVIPSTDIQRIKLRLHNLARQQQGPSGKLDGQVSHGDACSQHWKLVQQTHANRRARLAGLSIQRKTENKQLISASPRKGEACARRWLHDAREEVLREGPADEASDNAEQSAAT